MTNVDLTGRWVGDFWGSVRAHSFAEVSIANEALFIELRLNVNGSVGIFGGPLAANSDVTLTSNNNGAEPLTLNTHFEVAKKTELSGRWSDPGGNAGVFRFNRISDDSASNNDPLQVVQRTIHFPKITLYKNEVEQILAVMKTLLPTTNEVVVSATRNHSDIRMMAPDFWDNPVLPDWADQLTLNLTEATGGIARSLNLFLSQRECYFTAAGSSKVWVDGAIVGVDQLLRTHQSGFRRLYQRHALNFNALTMIGILILMPSLDLLSRTLLFVVGIEPRRVCRRPQLVRSRVYDKQDDEQVFSRSARPRRSNGCRA